jgi:hypothetical protein
MPVAVSNACILYIKIYIIYILCVSHLCIFDDHSFNNIHTLRRAYCFHSVVEYSVHYYAKIVPGQVQGCETLLFGVSQPKNNNTAAPSTMSCRRNTAEAVAGAEALVELRRSYASSLCSVEIPIIGRHYLHRDQRRVAHILKTGTMPGVDWTKVNREYHINLKQFLHRSVHVVFLDTSGNASFDVERIDLDQLMDKENADGCVVHGESLVYVATFSATVCVEITKIAEAKLGLSYKVSNTAKQGIQKIGNNDSMQSGEQAVCTANFGVSCCPQPSTAYSKNKSTLSIDAAVGSSRGGSVKCPAMDHSITSVVGETCHSDFLPCFKLDKVPAAD